MRSVRDTLVAVALLLAGCSSASGPGVVSVAGVPLFGAAEVSQPATASDRTVVATRLSDGSSGTFRPVSSRGGVETWAAGDGSAFAFRSGMLVATFALGHDLYSADAGETRALLGAGRNGSATRVHRYLDGENEMRLRAFECDVNIEVASGGQRTATEVCRGVGTSFRNQYRLLPGGEIAGSTQWVGDRVGYLRFETGTPRRALPPSQPILVPDTVIILPREAR